MSNYFTGTGSSSQVAAPSLGMTNARGPSSSASASTTASTGVLMVGPNFKVPSFTYLPESFRVPEKVSFFRITVRAFSRRFLRVMIGEVILNIQ